jgi:NAD(P)-dependent dehydrogenase (short-subunit alcohol dehydrogenase family)
MMKREVGNRIFGYTKSTGIRSVSGLCANREAQETKKDGQGCIINISSIARKIGGVLSLCYAAPKWPVLFLITSLSAKLAPNILVNTACPGIIETGMDAAFV